MRPVSIEEMVAQLESTRSVLRAGCIKYAEEQIYSLAKAYHDELTGVEEFAESIGLMEPNGENRHRLFNEMLSIVYPNTKKEETPCREST